MSIFQILIVFATFTQFAASWFSFKVDLSIQTTALLEKCQSDSSQNCESYSSTLTLTSGPYNQKKSAFAERPTNADAKPEKTKVIEFDFKKSKAFFFSQNNNFFAPADGSAFQKEIVFNSFDKKCNLDSSVSSRIAEDKVFVTVFLDCVQTPTLNTLSLQSAVNEPDDVKAPKGHEELDTTVVNKEEKSPVNDRYNLGWGGRRLVI